MNEVPAEVALPQEERIDLSIEERLRASQQIDVIVMTFEREAESKEALQRFLNAFDALSREWPHPLWEEQREVLQRIFRLWGSTVLDPSSLDFSLFSQEARRSIKWLAIRQALDNCWIEPLRPPFQEALRCG